MDNIKNNDSKKGNSNNDSKKEASNKSKNNTKFITRVNDPPFIISNLKELIKLSNSKKRKNNYDLYKLSKVRYNLKKLDSLIGLNQIKNDIVDHVIYFCQDIENYNDMLHTVITGNPGTGKTTLAKILANIYLDLGILKTNIFITAKRSDLIGRYLGETAIKTQEVIDCAMGGVLFIDEAYSIGNDSANGNKDSFSRECINTLNQNLSERAGQFICIIAGYKEDLEKSFFSNNKGLERRFPWKYNIEAYSAEELRQIFFQKIKESSWDILSEDICSEKWFKNNLKYFKNQGGDMEILFNKIKICHSKRVFGIDYIYKKVIIEDDVINGFNKFKNYYNLDTKDIIPLGLYT